MLLLRPVSESDLADLVALAKSIQSGMTTLPASEDFLRDRIDVSLAAFSARVRKPGAESYLFVLEDTDSRTIVGTSGLAARVGGFEPFYSYEIRNEPHVHAPLGIAKEIQVLHLQEIHRGPTEIGSLFLRPEYRRAGAGRLLSLARFLFIGAFPERFDDSVIAELRGYIDQTGRSPFWEAVGRRFFEFDFYAADLLSGLGDKAFIADLMPEHPIYANLLPEPVQAVIGKVHTSTTPALAMLLSEGFERTNEVDIFDAGPLLRVKTKDIRTIRSSGSATLRDTTESSALGVRCLLANSRLDFRACLGSLVTHEDGTVSIDRETAAALALFPGEILIHAPLK